MASSHISSSNNLFFPSKSTLSRKSFHGKDNKESYPLSFLPPPPPSHHYNNNKPLPSKFFQVGKWTARLKNSTNNYNNSPLSIKSALPRKWCNFMLRKNPDNSVYRSESFRFIQKTSSLEPLVPAKNNNRLRRIKLPDVPVNEDYVEPLDQVPNQLEPKELQSESLSKKSSTGEGSQDYQKEPEYNEIKESYNAPYYYSDTLKGIDPGKKNDSDPAYCSPCQSFRRIPPINPHSRSLRSLDKIISQQHRTSLNSRSCSQDELVSCNCISELPCDSPISSMARKRYETAFLPSSKNRPSHVQSPDVDTLLLSIEETYLKSEDDMQTEAKNYDSFSHRTRSNSVNYSSREPSISIHYHDRDNLLVPRSSTSITTTQTHTHVHTPRSSHSSPVADTFISSSAVRTIPLSEPLLQKRYANKISLSQYSTQSSSGCSTTNSSSPSQLSEIQRKGERGKTIALRRNCHLSLMKDNSISSLESIDSMKSDDIKYSHKSGFPVCGNQSNLKLLSPISDKSPLEPNIGIENSTRDSETELKSGSVKPDSEPYDTFRRNMLSEAEELTNVPWEMPKLKRRLKLLVDSGISLDFPQNRELDTQNSEENNKEIFSLAKRDQHLDPTVPEFQSFLPNDPSNKSATSTQPEVPHVYSSLLERSNVSLRLPVDRNPFVEFTGESEHHPQYGYRTQVNLYSDPGAENNAFSASQEFHINVPLYSERRNSSSKPDRCRMKLDFNQPNPIPVYADFDPTLELELQDWFHGAITRSEAEDILRATKEGSFLVRNCESSTYNRFSLSLKSSRGFIHVRIEPNSLGTYSLGEQEFQSVPHLVLYFMSHRLPIKGAEHVKLKYPIIIQLL